jgi:SAM-dependent methyltransferase
MATRYEKEAAFHDALAEGEERPADRFYAVNASSWDYYRGLILREARLAQERRGEAKILEYGSGIGAYSSLALAEAGYPSIGIDISEGSVRASAERAARVVPDVPVEYRAMNAEALEFEDDSFDLVCGNGIIHHLDLERAYAEVARVLRPDGVAVFAEPMGHNPLINLYRRLTPDQRTDDEHPLREPDLELARTYFGSLDARYFHLLVLAATPLRSTRVFDPLRRALDAVDRTLFDRVQPSRKLAWYVVLRLAQPS